ncbi:MAG: Snf7 family protein [Candidatus Methylarchaceae archaeon HK02M2]|nr:Snf7 family protein [Candidatus Methylarchaceae archaeon HK02M2]
MTVNFSKKWVKDELESRREKLKEAIKPAEPLKIRVKEAERKIKIQIKKLDMMLVKLRARDSFIFEKMVTAVKKHDLKMRNALLNEITEVRRTAKLVSQTKMLLEQITLRLNTIQNTGDLVVILAPVVSGIGKVRSGLARVIPETEYEIREISSVLSDVVMNAGRLEGITLNFEVANEDAEKILAEASAVAEHNMRDDFPKLPKLEKRSMSNVAEDF